MNTKKFKAPFSKKLTAAVMSAALIVSAAGGAGLAALRGSDTIQSVKAEDQFSWNDISPYALADDTGSGYYDAGTFELTNGRASMFNSSLVDPTMVGNTKIILSDTTNANASGVAVNFVDDDVAQTDGTYTYIAKGSETIGADGTTSVSWEIRAWPQNQNSLSAPSSKSVVDSNWNLMYEKAAPDWRNFTLGSADRPWLSITTLGHSTAGDAAGMNMTYTDARNTSMNITVNGNVISETNPLPYDDGTNVPVYAYNANPNGKFDDLIKAINPNAQAGDKIQYPVYQIPAYINVFWVENEIPTIQSVYSTGRETISGLRLDEMYSTVRVNKDSLANLKTGYDGFASELDAAYDLSAVSDNALTWTVDSFGVPFASEISWKYGMPDKIGNTVITRGINASASVFTKTDDFGVINRHAFDPNLGSLDIGNTRASFTIDTNVKYSIAYGYSRATASIDGSFTGTPKPEDPNEPDIIAGEIKSTTATSTNGTSHTIPCSENSVIKDRIVYDGLTDGTTYDVETSVVEKATGNYLVTNMKSTFVANANKYVDITINLNTSAYAGKSLVVFETIYLDGDKVDSHIDLNDANQTVTVSNATINDDAYIYRTVATNGASTSNTNNSWNNNWSSTVFYDKTIPAASNAVINDRVYYENLEDGQTYTVTAVLYDAFSGVALTTGQNSSLQFAANSRLGYIDVKIPFDTTNYAGRSIVVFETITTYDRDLRREVEVCYHRDLTDPDQTVFVSNSATTAGSITKTVATDASTGSHTLTNSSAAQIRDAVSYNGLVSGNMYTIYTSVYNKTTGKYVVTNQKQTFTPTSTSGTVNVLVDLNSTSYAGNSLVVFETIYLNGVAVCQHIDVNDTDQTVTVANATTPTVPTVPSDPNKPTEIIGIASNKSTAIDSVNKTHTMSYSKNAEILNRVDYDGLENGALYTVTSTVVDKTSGSAVLNPVSKAFTADTTKNYVDVNIPIDTTLYPGRSFVVYAVITRDGREVSSYKNLNDANATVTVATTDTVLTADNRTSKSVPVSQNVTLVDLVRYEGLTPGETYKITGHIVHKESANGKDFSSTSAVFDGDEGSLVTNGAKVVATQVVEFTPTTANGTATVQFNVNTVGLSGQHLVALEIIADKDSNAIVCEHRDINDANQTVVVKTSSNVYTGGNDMTLFFIIGSAVCVLAAGGVAAFLFIRKRRSN